MALKEDLLKPIWHAFTALDVDKCGKVSKSQLKVLSHNLCTLLNVPHDPVALEEHFRDDDEGPVSNQGYMPYLNKFILDKIEYFLKKLAEAMGSGWQQALFEDYKIGLHNKPSGLSAWELIDLIGSGQFSKGTDSTTVSMAINEVFSELVLDVLKQGYLWKKGHKRKNWTERWFVLKPNVMTYYTSEDLKDKKGDIILDSNCCVESLPDRDGKKCLFLVKCVDKSYEISASDKKKKQEWIQSIQTVVNLRKMGISSPHKDARQKRKAIRQKLQAEQEEVQRKMKDLQVSNETKQQEVEMMRTQLMEAAAHAAQEEKKRHETHMELQDRFREELEREQVIRQQMEVEVAQKSSELEQYLKRVQELEQMYHRLQEALDDEKQARLEEESARLLQARLLEEEATKRATLEKLHQEQELTIKMTEAEKKELETIWEMKDKALQEAMQQLDQLEKERMEALEQYEHIKTNLEAATSKTKSWKDKVAQHEGLIRLIQPGSKNPGLITNWGPASFTQGELVERERNWQEKKNSSAD
ncbi:PREDICTED: switch-associated protein 70 [Nanorana parkeri]|uniref:switch-associated protein 70 n=1 Tax=Nanorana parkeri TaxID=125878 RepID=UPI0008541A81|nr:PREDICTED: switch-associated protein 70 [Nanorana parkeri]